MASAKWDNDVDIAITVTDASGIIVEMNGAAARVFAKDGGSALVGQSVFDCHPGESNRKIRQLYESREASHYTIHKNGIRKSIHQIPRWQDGVFAGYVELSVPIPHDMPHFER